MVTAGDIGTNRKGTFDVTSTDSIYVINDRAL